MRSDIEKCREIRRDDKSLLAAIREWQSMSIDYLKAIERKAIPLLQRRDNDWFLDFDIYQDAVYHDFSDLGRALVLAIDIDRLRIDPSAILEFESELFSYLADVEPWARELTYSPVQGSERLDEYRDDRGDARVNARIAASDALERFEAVVLYRIADQASAGSTQTLLDEASVEHGSDESEAEDLPSLESLKKHPEPNVRKIAAAYERLRDGGNEWPFSYEIAREAEIDDKTLARKSKDLQDRGILVTPEPPGRGYRVGN